MSTRGRKTVGEAAATSHKAAEKSRGLRIGLVSLHTSPLETPGQGDAGGMNVYVLELARHLGRQGHEVELLTLAPPGADDRKQPVDQGVTLVELSVGLGEAVPKQQLVEQVEAFRRRLQQQPLFDILHSHYWLSAAATDPVARSWAVPHVVNFHTVAAVKNALLPAGDRPEQQLRLIQERELAHSASRAIASTETEASSLRRYYGLEPEQVVVIPPGVDTGLFTPNPTADMESQITRECPAQLKQRLADCLGLPSNDDDQPPQGQEKRQEQGQETKRSCFLLMLARVQPLKGQKLAIHTLARLREKLKQKDRPCPRLVLAGAAAHLEESRLEEEDKRTPENYAQHIRQEAKRLGVEDLVIFVDALPRPLAAALLRRAALLLAPSFSETFGLVTLEAAASGTPTVATRTDGLIDSVVPETTGFLVEGRDPETWAETVARILENSEDYTKLSAAAVAYARQHDWNQTACQMSQLYRQLVDESAQQLVTALP